MKECLFYIGADTPATRYAKAFLESWGCPFTDDPSDAVSHLLLNVPSFSDQGKLVGGGDLEAILCKLPSRVALIGGKLNVPLLQNYSTWDLLQNEAYLAENAAITADCALRVAYAHFPAVLTGTTVLILGWGRISKCLAQLLRAIGANVTVSARKEADLAMAHALGYDTVELHAIGPHLPRYRILFNTVPAMILPEALLQQTKSNCLKIELASVPGIAGSDVISARGLPGKLAPESSGHLIAKTVLDLCRQKEVIP